MRQPRIANLDNLFRHCTYPIAFRSKGFAREKFFHLTELPGRLESSLAWQLYLPSEKLVHEYGCETASGINEKARAIGRFKEQNRKLYCGAYQLTAAAVRTLVGAENLNEIVGADVVHHVEDGRLAHVALTIVLADSLTDIEGTKTAIVDRLWNSCVGPMRHVCKGDEETGLRPGDELPIPPLGEYKDSRGRISRFLCLLRFYFWRWQWHKQNSGQE
jgi:hypothetical protein